MTQTNTAGAADTLGNLDYALEMAKAGREQPLLGGPIGLMWGVLLAAVFLFQYGVLSGALGLPVVSLGIAWLAFAVVGGIGVLVLGRRQSSRPGAQSLNNKVETHVWIMFTAALLSLVTGVILNQLLKGGSAQMWDMILVFGFAGQALAYGVVARLTGLGWVAYASVAAAVSAAATLAVYGDIVIYLVGAAGVFLSVIIPSIISIRRAA